MSWDSALAAADAVAAGYFDTQVFVLTPMAKPARDVNAKPQLDPSRAAFEFRGTLESDPELNELGANRNTGSRSDGSRNVSRLCLTALAADWAYLPRQGDEIISDGQRYSVAAPPDRDGTDRIVLWLNKAKT